MNLPPESGQAGRSSTSSMNGRSWLQIPMGEYLAQTGSAGPISDLPYFPRMQKTSGYRIGFAALLGMKDFSGLQAVAADRYSAYPDFGCW